MTVTFEFRGTTTVFKSFRDHVRGLKNGDIKLMLRAANARYSRAIAQAVRDEYVGAKTHRSSRTEARYRRPPRSSGSGGVSTPDPRTFMGASPLMRSGTMSRSVVIRRFGSKDSLFITLDPRKTYPDGKRVADIGELMESGFEWKTTLTKKVLAFLHVLKREAGEGDAGSGALQWTRHVGEKILISQSPRPVWATVADKVARMRYAPVFEKAMKAWLRDHFHNPTGKPTYR